MCHCGRNSQFSVHKDGRLRSELAAVLADFVDNNAAARARRGARDQVAINASHPGRGGELGLRRQKTAAYLPMSLSLGLQSAPRSMRMTADATAVRSRPATP